MNKVFVGIEPWLPAKQAIALAITTRPLFLDTIIKKLITTSIALESLVCGPVELV